MASSDASSGFDAIRQYRRFAVILAVVSSLLVTVYFIVLRLDYDVLFSDLKPVDAAAVIEELELQGVSYRLAEGGRTVEVPSGQADAVRLSIVGSNMSSKGLVGFELFNETEMGLTDFAQKIKYQRALQGELARSIMMMDGIDVARVHIAMPERAMFRNVDTRPTAAITIVTEIGTQLTEDRIDGIQRLVAAAVPELNASDVVILDEQGQIVELGSTATDAGSENDAARASEIAAVEVYYKDKVQQVLNAVWRGEQPQLILSMASPRTVSASLTSSGNTELADEASQSRIRLVLVSDEPISSTVEESMFESIAAILPEGVLVPEDFSILQPEHDTLVAGSEASATKASSSPIIGLKAVQLQKFLSVLDWRHAAGAAAVFLVMIMIAVLRRSRKRKLNPQERKAFADLLKAEIESNERQAA